MPHWPWVLLTVVLWITSALMDLVVPQVVARVIDEGIIARDAPRLAALVGLVAGLIVLRGLSLFASRASTRRYEGRIARRLRYQLYDRLQRLPYAYYDRADSGDVITRSISDVNHVRMFAGNGSTEVLRVVGIYVVIVIGMALIHVPLTLVAVGVLVPMAALALWYGRKVRPMWTALQRQHAAVAKAVTENLNGIRVVKAFAAEDREVHAFDREAQLLRHLSLRPARFRSRVMPVLLFFTGIGTVLVLWVGGRLAIDGVLSVGVLVAFYYYFARLIQPTRRLGFIVQRIARAAASGERVFELLDEPSTIASASDATTPDKTDGRVAFDDAAMAYHRTLPVLEQVTAELPPGSVVGVVGATGAGKTSLVNLIPRFYDVQTGAVRVDGVDVRDQDLARLRSRIAIVPQEAFLFSDSVRNNIAFGDPQANVERVVDAAKSAGAYDFITELPEGFESVVGERGVGLSGGQRQRVTIARALLLDAPILILDDATASVDTETERRIQAALRERSRGRTTFVVSHRISSVQQADQILVLDRGRIVDRGTHDELRNRPGFYRELCKLQTQKADLAGTGEEVGAARSARDEVT